MSQAKRFDTGKPEYDLIPPHSLEAVALVFTMGAKKYARDNWRKGMAWSRALNSLLRHVNAFQKGEDLDPESGLSHMAHVCANAMFLLEYSRSHPELDDRFHATDAKE